MKAKDCDSREAHMAIAPTFQERKDARTYLKSQPASVFLRLERMKLPERDGADSEPEVFKI